MVEYQMVSAKPCTVPNLCACRIITFCLFLFLRCLIPSWFTFYVSGLLPFSFFCLLSAIFCRFLFTPSLFRWLLLFITLVCITSWCFFSTGLLSITLSLYSNRPILTGLFWFSPWCCLFTVFLCITFSLSRCRTFFVDLVSFFCLAVLL